MLALLLFVQSAYPAAARLSTGLEDDDDPAQNEASGQQNENAVNESPLPGAPVAEAVPHLSLQECLSMAIQNRSPEWNYGIDAYKAQAQQAQRTWIPRINVEDQLGALPDEGWHGFGVLNRVKANAGIPIYDFGRTHKYFEAASGRVEVETKGLEKNRAQETVEVVQLYYGLLLARESLNILYDARGKVAKYRDQMEKKESKKSTKANHAELLQVRYEMLKLDNQIAQAEMQQANAYAALSVKLGFPKAEGFDIEDRFLRPVKLNLENLDGYQNLARTKRPEVTMLERGIEARKALVEAEQRAFFPAFLLGGFFEQSVSSVRTYDIGLNYKRGGLGLMMNWVFDYNATEAKIKSARSEYFKLLEQQRQALPAIQLDVTRAYRETTRLKEQVERGKEARKIGRALLFFAKSNWDIGIGDPLKMKDALIRFNEARFDHLKSIFDFNVAVAKLSQAVGEDLFSVSSERS